MNTKLYAICLVGFICTVVLAVGLLVYSVSLSGKRDFDFKAKRIDYPLQAEREALVTTKMTDLKFGREIFFHAQDKASDDEKLADPPPKLSFKGIVSGARPKIVLMHSGRTGVYGEGDKVEGWTIERITKEKLDIAKANSTHSFTFGPGDFSLGTGGSSDRRGRLERRRRGS